MVAGFDGIPVVLVDRASARRSLFPVLIPIPAGTIWRMARTQGGWGEGWSFSAVVLTPRSVYPPCTSEWRFERLGRIERDVK